MKFLIRFRINLSWVALLFLLLFHQAGAQNIPSKLDSLFQVTLDSILMTLDVKGLSAAVNLPNGSVWAGGSGISSQNPVDSISPEHVFAIGSTTKTLTAACILQLHDEGVLSLEDSLHQWLPPFNYVADHITIRQLLQHQSGIFDLFQHPNFQQQMNAQPLTIWEPETVLQTFLTPPVFSPGTSWGYSSSNYLLLGLIIENATGMAYHEAIRERFLTPLELNSFSLFPYEPYEGILTHLWLDFNGNGIPSDAHSFFSMLRSSFSAGWAAGAYYANSSDLSRWMKALFTDALIAPATLEDAMTTIPTAFPAGSRYGLGIIQRSFLGITAFGHGGDLGFSTNAFFFPEKNISIAVNCNDGTANSWVISPVITALLRTFQECEALITNTSTPEGGKEIIVDIGPNPVREKLNLRIKTPSEFSAEVSIHDITGRAINSFQIEITSGQNVEIDCDAWPKGVYFYQIKAHRKLLKAGQIVK